jgi:hypothetical protein
MSLLPPANWTVYAYPTWPEKIPAAQPIVVHWEGNVGKGRKKLLRFTHRDCGEAFHCVAAFDTVDFPPGALAIFDRHKDKCPARPKPKPPREEPPKEREHESPQTALF